MYWSELAFYFWPQQLSAFKLHNIAW
uniref:Uncharacterized protein n=1 Tax=Rhizophora mucronata TaxID=61149 RepID=A0A2P2QIL4_RHIMU